jgi:DNA gyrase subunit A
VVGVVSVRDGDDIMLMTAQGMVNRTHVSEIRLIGRNTQGVRIMNLYEGDKIASIAKIANEDQPETAASETAASETATGGPPASGPTAGESPTSEPTTPDEPTPLE